MSLGVWAEEGLNKGWLPQWGCMVGMACNL